MYAMHARKSFAWAGRGAPSEDIEVREDQHETWQNCIYIGTIMLVLKHARSLAESCRGVP